MEQEKILKVTKSEAREWYKSGNRALIEIALKLFKEEELKMTTIEDMIEYIMSNSDVYKLTDIQRIQVNALKSRKNGNISAVKLLKLYALYYNKGWKKELGNTGYFITEKKRPKDSYKCCFGQNPNLSFNLTTSWEVESHTSVSYPGIAYFKNEADAKMVLEKFDKDMLNRLYTDL